MKSTGIIRRIDDLGRVVIPKEIRKRLNIRENDALELFVENNRLVFEKYNNTDEIAQNCARWVDQYKNKIISITNIEGKTSCVFHSNLGIRQASVIYCPSDKFDLNVAICYCAKKVGFQIEGI